jgi:putative addiction module component (TIGR02574 family)
LLIVGIQSAVAHACYYKRARASFIAFFSAPPMAGRFCLLNMMEKPFQDFMGLGKIPETGDGAMSDYQTVLNSANHLPVGDRVQLIQALWDSLPADSLPPLSQDWITEIDRRSDEYDAGLVQTISWEAIRGEAMRQIGSPE